ncbi:MAG: TetR/AcrR family transcriptional regulator [Actinomycetota bacterium]
MPQATTTKSARREEILSTAVSLFAERGYGATSIDEIGQAVGISGPALYWHFEGKESMLAESLAKISAALLENGMRCVAEGKGGEDTLAKLIAGHVDFALTRPELITLQERDLVHVEEAAQREIRRSQRRYVELWTDCILEFAPKADRKSIRDAVHATFGLINSTPHLTAANAASAALLKRLAMASLLEATRIGV